MEDNNRKRKGDRNEQRAKRPPPQPTGPCWFCKFYILKNKNINTYNIFHCFL